jgi:hypothetical protein
MCYSSAQNMKVERFLKNSVPTRLPCFSFRMTSSRCFENQKSYTFRAIGLNVLLFFQDLEFRVKVLHWRSCIISPKLIDDSSDGQGQQNIAIRHLQTI